MCHLPLKDHPGPVRQSKCLVGMLRALEQRVVDLEKANEAHKKQLLEQEVLYSEFQEALFGTFSALERIEYLQRPKMSKFVQTSELQTADTDRVLKATGSNDDDNPSTNEDKTSSTRFD